MRISDWSSDVCSSDLPFEGAALERKPFAIAVVIIARRAPESEHRILFLRFEDVAAYEVGVFVGLEVAEANDGGVRVIGTCELGDTASEDIDEIVGRMRVSACEFPDLALGFRARPLGVDERHGMDLDVGVDDEFHTGTDRKSTSL